MLRRFSIKTALLLLLLSFLAYPVQFAHSAEIFNGKIVFAAGYAFNNVDLFLMEVGKRSVRKLAEKVDARSEAIFTPDGQQIIYRSITTSGLHIFDLNTNKDRVLVEKVAGQLDLIDGSPDGKRISYATYPASRDKGKGLIQVNAVEIETGNDTKLFTIEYPLPASSPFVQALHWRQIGKALIYSIAWGSTRELHSVDPAGQNDVVIYRGKTADILKRPPLSPDDTQFLEVSRNSGDVSFISLVKKPRVMWQLRRPDDQAIRDAGSLGWLPDGKGLFKVQFKIIEAKDKPAEYGFTLMMARLEEGKTPADVKEITNIDIQENSSKLPVLKNGLLGIEIFGARAQPAR